MKDLSRPQIRNIFGVGRNWPIAMWTMPTPTPLSGTSVSRRRRRAPTPAKMKKKLKKPTLKFQNKDLSQSEVMAPFHLLDPAHPKPTFLLPQLPQLAALLLPLLLELYIAKTLSFIRSPVCWVQM
jgi:hypothetical protein